MLFNKRRVLFVSFIFFAASMFAAKSYGQQLIKFGCDEVGAVEYRYSPQGDCGTKEEKRTCCGGGQTANGVFVIQNWSGWNEDCPEVCVDKTPCTSDADCCGGKVCSPSSGTGGSLRYCMYKQQDECLESDKPTCSILNGTCSYICTCSNGKWINCVKNVFCKKGFILKGTSSAPCCEAISLLLPS